MWNFCKSIVENNYTYTSISVITIFYKLNNRAFRIWEILATNKARCSCRYFERYFFCL